MGTASEENQISERADETSTSRRPHLRVVSGHLATAQTQPASSRQLALPLQWHAGGIPAHPSTPDYLRVVPDEDDREELAELGNGRPHPVAWAAQMSRAIFEVALGERPATQLRKHIAADQLTTLAIRGTAYARHPAARSATGMTRLRKIRAVRCCLVAPGTIEASAVVVGAARSHAVALRMESRPGAWLVTAIDFR